MADGRKRAIDETQRRAQGSMRESRATSEAETHAAEAHTAGRATQREHMRQERAASKTHAESNYTESGWKRDRQEQHQSPPRPSMNVPFGVSRETFVLMSHVITTSVSRETSRKARRHWKASFFFPPPHRRERGAAGLTKSKSATNDTGRAVANARASAKTRKRKRRGGEKGGKGKGERGERRTGCEDARKTLTAIDNARKLAPRARR